MQIKIHSSHCSTTLPHIYVYKYTMWLSLFIFAHDIDVTENQLSAQMEVSTVWVVMCLINWIVLIKHERPALP